MTARQTSLDGSHRIAGMYADLRTGCGRVSITAVLGP